LPTLCHVFWFPILRPQEEMHVMAEFVIEDIGNG
jgi:hypothetical protein